MKREHVADPARRGSGATSRRQAVKVCAVRSRWGRRLRASAALAVLLALVVPAARANASILVQGLAIPAYFYPGPQWTQMEQGAPAVGIAIMNPNNGPGGSIDPNYVAAVQQSQAAGLSVLGYVYTQYGARALSSVESDVDTYYAWYGVNGIFLDQASTSCTADPYYATLYAYIKAKGGQAIVMLNPGTQTSQCYMAAADIVVTFEGSYTSYAATYHAPSWETRYAASRFEHIVYNTPTIADMRNAIRLSKQRRAGWVYVTNDVLPNPYDRLPTGSYWRDELTLAHS